MSSKACKERVKTILERKGIKLSGRAEESLLKLLDHFSSRFSLTKAISLSENLANSLAQLDHPQIERVLLHLSQTLPSLALEFEETKNVVACVGGLKELGEVPFFFDLLKLKIPIDREALELLRAFAKARVPRRWILEAFQELRKRVKNFKLLFPELMGFAEEISALPSNLTFSYAYFFSEMIKGLPELKDQDLKLFLRFHNSLLEVQLEQRSYFYKGLTMELLEFLKAKGDVRLLQELANVCREKEVDPAHVLGISRTKGRDLSEIIEVLERLGVRGRKALEQLWELSDTI